MNLTFYLIMIFSTCHSDFLYMFIMIFPGFRTPDMYKRRDRNTDHFCHMVSGYFMLDDVIPAEDDEDDLEEEEEEEDIQFLNYKEMNGLGQGKQLYEGRKMKCCKGKIKNV